MTGIAHLQPHQGACPPLQCRPGLPALSLTDRSRPVFGRLGSTRLHLVGASELRVMVVEDYEGMQALVQRCLRQMGFTAIRGRANAVEALAALRLQPADLIISDYGMPKMDGLELLESVRSDPATRGASFIMLSGSSDKEVLREAMQLGADDFLLKPATPDALRSAVCRLAGRRLRERSAA